MLPKVDFWFIAMVLWALAVPCLFDAGDIVSGDRDGLVSFHPLDLEHLFGPGVTYQCTRANPETSKPRPMPS